MEEELIAKELLEENPIEQKIKEKQKVFENLKLIEKANKELEDTEYSYFSFEIGGIVDRALKDIEEEARAGELVIETGLEINREKKW